MNGRMSDDLNMSNWIGEGGGEYYKFVAPRCSCRSACNKYLEVRFDSSTWLTLGVLSRLIKAFSRERGKEKCRGKCRWFKPQTWFRHHAQTRGSPRLVDNSLKEDANDLVGGQKREGTGETRSCLDGVDSPPRVKWSRV